MSSIDLGTAIFFSFLGYSLCYLTFLAKQHSYKQEHPQTSETLSIMD